MNVAWVLLHRKSPHWSKGMEIADTTCALSGSISGAGKSIEIILRMCGPPLYDGWPLQNLWIPLR